jgi:hypothetical protein
VEGAPDLDVVGGVTAGAVGVEVDGEPDGSGVAQDEMARVVVEVGAARALLGDGDDAVAVVGDLQVVEVVGEE